MTLLIQKQCEDEAERSYLIKKLEAEGWAVNLESTEDDLDYEEYQ